MLGKLNTGSRRGTRLRALDEQTLVPPDGDQTSQQYSKIQLIESLHRASTGFKWKESE